MMQVSKGLAIGLAMVGMADTAGAKVFDCAIKAGASQGGFITERYFFDYDAEGQRVQVFDALIEHFTGGPIPGKVGEDTGSRVSFNWSVMITNDVGQQARMLYTAAYIKASQMAIITARPGGGDYVGSWDARGSCTVK